MATRTFQVSLPRYDVEIYTVEAASKAEALRKARELQASGSAEYDVVAGRRIVVEEI